MTRVCRDDGFAPRYFERPYFGEKEMTVHPALHTPVCDILGCRYPIFQAGMGGVARADLVAAVTGAGGYGFLGMVREAPQFIEQQILTVRQRVSGRFGVNLIPAATAPGLFHEELAVCLEAGVDSLCFFWDVDEAAITRAKEAGITVVYQVGSVSDAILAAEAGADALIVQGVEAGGHVRGQVSSLVLLQEVVRKVDCPVIASGGFASGAGLVAALALGAQGIHCGTAFLATQESFANAYHKDRIVAASSEDTVHTDLFALNWPTGAPVRVLHNSLTDKLNGKYFGHHPHETLTQRIGDESGMPIFRYSTDSPLQSTQGQLEQMALYAGQVAGLIDDVPTAATLIESIVAEARRVLADLGYLNSHTVAYENVG